MFALNVVYENATMQIPIIDSVQGDCKKAIGYAAFELLNQPFSKLLGENSDPYFLKNSVLMETAVYCRLQLILYDRSQQPRPMTIRSHLVHGKYNRLVYNLKVACSCAVPLKLIYDPVFTPRALVSLEPPHAIHMMNNALIRRFNLQHIHDGVAGQTVNSFPGSFWPALIELAADGRVVGGRYHSGFCNQNEGEVIVCTPIADAANGWIRSVLVELLPAAEYSQSSGPSLPQTHDTEENQNEETVARSIKNEKAAPTDAEFEPTSWKISSKTSGCKSSHTIRRRAESAHQRNCPHTDIETSPLCSRKAATESRIPLSSAVVLTHDLLRALRGQPLPLAARAVGVSATSFKRACRKLGIDRWEYTRGPGRTLRAKARPDWQEVGPNEGATTPQGCRSAATRDSEDPELDSCDVGLNPILRARCDSAAEDWEAGDDALALGMLGRQWMAA